MKNCLYRISFLCLVTTFGCLAPAPAGRAESAAQLGKHERRVEKRLAHYRAGSYVQISFRDDTEAYGSLGELSSASFQLTNADNNKVETYSYGQVNRVKSAREYIGAGSGPEHHIRLWIPLVIGAAAAGGAVAAVELTR